KNKWKFLCSTNILRWEYVWRVLHHSINRIGSWRGAENSGDGTIAFSMQGEMKMFNIMTNHYELWENQEKPIPPIQNDYKSTFNHVDRFNRQLYEINYPHKIKNWKFKFSSVFIRIILVNCCNISNELHNNNTPLRDVVEQIGSNL